MAIAIERKLDEVVAALRGTLTRVVEGVGRPRRPQDLSRLLSVNRSLSSSLYRALGAADAFAAAHLMPGPEALRLLLTAAHRKGVDQSTIDAAGQAVSAFEQLIERDAGGRSGLEAIISESLPDARRKLELASKQSIFRGVASLKGVMAEVYFTTYLAHPARQPARHDLAMIVGLRGLRRTRPSATVQVSNRNLSPEGRDDVRLTLDGKPVDGMDGIMLAEYCSSPPPKLRAYQKGVCTHYVIADQGFGPDSAVDIVFGEVCPGGLPRYQERKDRPTSGTAAEVEQPVKTLVFDTLLHEGVWPGCHPELRIYDTAVRGTAHPDDPARDIDRLNMAESIESLGQGVGKLRAIEIPSYPEMLRQVCAKMGWDIEKFRGYRSRIQYPFYGSQVCMVFNLPEARPD